MRYHIHKETGTGIGYRVGDPKAACNARDANVDGLSYVSSSRKPLCESAVGVLVPSLYRVVCT